jgi:hypothetical protein
VMGDGLVTDNQLEGVGVRDHTTVFNQNGHIDESHSIM